MIKRRLRSNRPVSRFFRGNAEKICQDIVKNCYNKKYFQTSLGHFSSFWMRDFGICVEALLKLGYDKEVYKTLEYALSVYSRNNILTTTISNEDEPFNAFSYSPDTLPLLLRSLRLAKANDLIDIYKPFLNQEILNYFEIVIDKSTGLVKKSNFSSMKDNAKRQSSCYNNCMAAMLKNEVKLLNLVNPLEDYNYEKLIIDNFWQGYYFYDDLYSNYVAGDANVFPFWCGVIKDKEKLKKVIGIIKESKLDDPFPLKYTEKKDHDFKYPMKLFAKNYQGDSIWMNIGLCYLDVVASYDKKLLKKYLSKYSEIIENNKNFLELFTPEGLPYKTLFYKADEGMLWSCKYLDLLKKC